MRHSGFNSYLRSINVRQDARFPERIAHYHPTAKGVVLIRALAGFEDERAFMVTAPYGSGKSLTATFLLQVLENSDESRPIVRAIIKNRLAKVSPEVAQWAKSQIRGGAHRKRGMVLAIEGRTASIAESLRSAVVEACRRVGISTRSFSKRNAKTIDNALVLLEALAGTAFENGIGPIAIVWDEFGRHLESLVTEGRAEQLGELQQLAEFVARQEEVPFTLSLLLHQGFLRYAGNLPESARAEWTKIEGRFRSIQYVDDSPEVYRLIAELLSETRPTNGISLKKCAQAAQRAKALGLFLDLSKTELKTILRGAHPLAPAVLYLLPRLAARVAQNERTMFDFLASVDSDDEIGPDQLFDYFSPAMQADTAVGGTYRQWLETQSALSKIGSNPRKEEALKATCLLSLGIAGERFRARRDLVAYAMSGFSAANGVPTIIDDLIAENLLLYRKHHDEVAVWHGTDSDLRGRLEDEKQRRRSSFDAVCFLEREFPPTPWRPVEYNADYGVRRYFRSEYGRPESDRELVEEAVSRRDAPDGRVVYMLAGNRQQLAEARRVASASDDEAVVVVVPTRPLPLDDIALEVNALQAMQADAEVIGQDPLVLPELKQMTDDARGRLARLLDGLLHPSEEGSRWYHCGEELGCRRDADVRRKLSEICNQVFPKTPRLLNEMIVRRKPSPVVINSRKKLVMAILERSGTKGLGIEGNFPDASMFRTLLLNTGVYRPDGDRWRYARPDELSDSGLSEVWRRIESFLTVPSARSKRPAKLFDTLMAPPIGLRAGLLPIFIAAGLKAFPGLRTIARDGDYVQDLTPSEIELLCKEPERFSVQVYRMERPTARYVEGLIKLFGGGDARSADGADLVRRCFDSAAVWLDRLPPTALTRSVSPQGETLRDLLRSGEEPVTLFLKSFPAGFGRPLSKSKALLTTIEDAAKSLHEVLSRNYAEARGSIAAELGSIEEHADLRKGCRWWASQFDVARLRNELAGTPALAFLKTLSMDYDSDELLVGAIAASTGVELPQRWDERSPGGFSRAVREAVRNIEEAVLRTGDDSAVYGSLVENRIRNILGRFAQHKGRAHVRKLLDKMAQEEWRS